MANQVYLGDDGFIHSTYEGDQTESSIKAMARQIPSLSYKLRARGRPVLILVDISQSGRQTSESRRAAAQVLQKLDYDKVAVFGGKPNMRYVINLIARSMSGAHKIQHFSTQAEAEAFLRQGS